MNPDWNSYVESILFEIKEEMAIESPFSASLKYLIVRDTETHDNDAPPAPVGTFATLVIQLPSKYIGGQLLMKHDGHSNLIDQSRKEFSTFFSVYYNDCEREILPITEGVRVCLEYDLITNTMIPRTPCSLEEIQLLNLFESWNCRDEPFKLIYVPSQNTPYLSLATLKARDKAVANFFKRTLTVHFGYLKMKSYSNTMLYSKYDEEKKNFQVDESYWLTNLVDLNNSPFEYENSLTVNFDDEVIPVNIMTKYKKREWYTGSDEDGHLSIDYFRAAVLVIWPTFNLIPVLCDGGANSGTITRIFLRENEKKKEWNVARTIATMVPRVRTNKFEDTYLKYKEEIDETNAIPLLEAMIEYNNVALLRTFLTHNTRLNDETIQTLRSQCDKFGWLSLLTELKNMFKRLDISCEAIRYLEMLVGNDAQLPSEKNILWQSLAEILLEKYLLTENKRYYEYDPRLDKHVEKENGNLEDERKIIYSTLIISQKLNRTTDVVKFIQYKPLTILFPIVMRLGSDVSTVKLRMTCLEQLRKSIKHNNGTYSWRYKYQHNCACNDCKGLKMFIESNSQRHYVNVELDRQIHIEEMLKDNHHETPRYLTTVCDDYLKIEKKKRMKMTTLEILRHETGLLDPLSELVSICLF